MGIFGAARSTAAEASSLALVDCQRSATVTLLVCPAASAHQVGIRLGCAGPSYFRKWLDKCCMQGIIQLYIQICIHVYSIYNIQLSLSLSLSLPLYTYIYICVCVYVK